MVGEAGGIGVMGSLPKNQTIDDPLTVREFARWLGVSEDWVRRRQNRLPGVIEESREVVRFHPRTYIERRLKPINGKKAA